MFLHQQSWKPVYVANVSMEHVCGQIAMIKLHQLHDFVYIHKVSTAYHQSIPYKYIYIYI